MAVACPPAPTKAKIFRWLDVGIRNDMLAAREAALGNSNSNSLGVCKTRLQTLLQTLRELPTPEDPTTETRYAILACALARLQCCVQRVLKTAEDCAEDCAALESMRLHVVDTLERFLFC